MEEQILVSIDPLRAYHHIVDTAVHFARTLDMPLLLYGVHHIPVPAMAVEGGLPGTAYMPPEMPERTRKQLESRMKEVCDLVRKRWPLTDYAHDLGFTAPALLEKASALIGQAEQRNPYMMILQRENSGNWWNTLIGTTETTVAKEAPCPVLIVPGEQTIERPERIMYMLEAERLKEQKSHKLQWVAGFTKKFDASLAIAYIPEDNADLSEREVRNAVKRIREEAALDKFFHYEFAPQNTARAMIRVAELSQTDILAFQFQSSPFWSRLLGEEHGAHGMILNTPGPTLVV